MKTLIGEQIRKLRELRNVTQEEIASALGMSRQRFARIERGTADVSYEHILDISNYLGIEPHQITDVCENVGAVSYRSGDAPTVSFDQIHEMIAFFYANKSLYKRMNPEND